MAKLTLEDLKKIKEEAKASTSLREGGQRAKVTVHMGTCGIASGARKVMTALLDEITAQGAQEIMVTTSGCAGLCSKEPMATVEILGQPPVKYCDLDGEKIKEIVREHLLGGKIVQQYALAIGSETTF